jgi:two-component system, OmpR family, sensor histidine kinase CpxA
MRSLFLKIFLSYWVAQALFVILAISVTLAIRPQGEPARWEFFRTTVANRAAAAYERGGSPELREDLEHVERAVHDRVFFFDDQGRELAGRDAPEWARQLAAGVNVRRTGLLGWLEGDRRGSKSVVGSSGRRYTLVIERPLPGHFLFPPSRTPGLGMVIAILSSGLVCFLLARYLTSPIVRLRAATHRLAEGDLTARAGTIGSRRRDEIAELVRDFDGMAARIESLVTAQSRLLNDISHELRSPLARLNVALGLARQRTGPEAAGTLDRIEKEAERLNELIGRLLSLARLEGGDQSMQRAPVDLEQLVNEICKDADFEAQGRNCRVRCQVGQGCVVMGNADLLHSAVENVVRNAMRYTREGTEVEILLERWPGPGGPEARILVSDHGPGVPVESLDKLFRPFYRLGDARERQTGGVGLGLAITERCIRLHGGSIKASNRAEGGLEVEIRLPLLSQSVPAAADDLALVGPKA